MQLIGAIAVGSERCDWCSARTGAIEAAVPRRAATANTVLPIGQWLKTGGVQWVDHDVVPLASGHHEHSVHAGHEAPWLRYFNALLIRMRHIWRSPWLGFDRVVTARQS